MDTQNQQYQQGKGGFKLNVNPTKFYQQQQNQQQAQIQSYPKQKDEQQLQQQQQNIVPISNLNKNEQLFSFQQQTTTPIHQMKYENNTASFETQNQIAQQQTQQENVEPTVIQHNIQQNKQNQQIQLQQQQLQQPQFQAPQQIQAFNNYNQNQNFNNNQQYQQQQQQMQQFQYQQQQQQTAQKNKYEHLIVSPDPYYGQNELNKSQIPQTNNLVQNQNLQNSIQESFVQQRYPAQPLPVQQTAVLNLPNQQQIQPVQNSFIQQQPLVYALPQPQPQVHLLPQQQQYVQQNPQIINQPIQNNFVQTQQRNVSPQQIQQSFVHTIPQNRYIQPINVNQPQQLLDSNLKSTIQRRNSPQTVYNVNKFSPQRRSNSPQNRYDNSRIDYSNSRMLDNPINLYPQNSRVFQDGSRLISVKPLYNKPLNRSQDIPYEQRHFQCIDDDILKMRRVGRKNDFSIEYSKLIKDAMIFEKQLYTIRTDLLKREDFDLKALYKLFDSNDSGQIIVNELQTGLREFDLTPERNDLNLFMKRFSTSQNYNFLNFGNFCNIIYPLNQQFDEQEYRKKQFGDIISSETRFLIKELFRTLLNEENSLEDYKQYLLKLYKEDLRINYEKYGFRVQQDPESYRLDLEEIFKEITKRDDLGGHISPHFLRLFLRENGAYTSKEVINELFSRININRYQQDQYHSQGIDFQSFFYEMCPSIQIQQQN